ncbi:NAD(P)/FAD-dependent oxidoreductase [Vibrio sp. EA2]|uniref:NAD(P)/FAD-dependent oxidoreductase n=1 Tax=Vibrio sp. EA2 TaxID=3079860 RepID=UPI00294A0501|nr:NAD(P)/FAD-dependent oxidoreductase [Vibrio sp. EA2]MDV6250536.1 NAD(P)/FAD-dependent oxidoreductase [Vibrio sp. EA2]
MKSKQYDVVIVGSGLAGMAAAKEFANLGIRYLVVEENRHLGGQLIRKQPGQPPLDKFQDKVKKAGFQLVDDFAENTNILRNSRILGIFGDQNIYLEDAQGKTHLIESRFILLATGGREKFMPFKGWTLPGVISFGGCQVMMKSSGILPGKNTVIAGGGPLLYVLSGQILRHGGKIPLILDRSSMIDKMKFLKLMPPQWSKIGQVVQDMSTITRHFTPMHSQHAVVEARGDGQLEEVVYAKLDKHGKFIPDTEHTVSADSLAIGQGLVANTELASGAGCDVRYSDQLGGWIVATDSRLKTSKDSIYAAGEITGIGGGEQSLREGELAALVIAEQLGHLSDATETRIKQLQHFRSSQLGFNKFISELSSVPTPAWEDVADDTVICRCEDITMGDIRKAMELGLDSVSLLKRGTRIGMGRCQGRTCSPILNDILTANNLTATSTSVRFPVKPVNLISLESFSDE